jgi:sugar phosphate isomerase/epimerase
MGHRVPWDGGVGQREVKAVRLRVAIEVPAAYPRLGAGGGWRERLAAVAIHGLRFDVNCSILFTELPLLKRPAAARAPGTGELDFEALFGQLAAQGYRGWIGLEYQPDEPADSSTSFGWRKAHAG